MEGDRCPQHVGLIPDGTRRYCRNVGLDLETGYRQSFDLLSQFVTVLLAEEVAEVTCYLCSNNNLSRPPTEVTALLNAIEYTINESFREVAAATGAQLVHIGDQRRLPSRLANALSSYEINATQTRHVTASTPRVNLLIAYDPLDEIRAIRDRTSHPSYPEHHLWIQTPIDLVIRSAGVMLLSGFPPLQSSYAIMYCVAELFPDMTVDQLRQALAYYSNVKRMFGH
jgi:undecaprenyl diphosphate synthase